MYHTVWFHAEPMCVYVCTIQCDFMQKPCMPHGCLVSSRTRGCMSGVHVCITLCVWLHAEFVSASGAPPPRALLPRAPPDSQEVPNLPLPQALMVPAGGGTRRAEPPRSVCPSGHTASGRAGSGAVRLCGVGVTSLGASCQASAGEGAARSAPSGPAACVHTWSLSLPLKEKESA